jgi:hypothetical protein
MRPAPIVPLEKGDRRKHSDATHRFSDTILRKFGALARESEEIEVFDKHKPSARRRIAPTHPWYRKPRLPDSTPGGVTES